ncbi:MAG: hypothetical protein AAFW67_00130 [Cyanobacteria bacterium J06638_38]
MSGILGKLLTSAIALVMITAISACSIDSPVVVEQDGLSDVADITQNPASYIGKSVLVRNDVIQIIGERGLILDKDRAFYGETILALNISEQPLKVSVEDTPEVLIMGKVERLALASIQQNYDLKLDFNLYNQYENQPVIIAEDLILSPDPEDLTRHPEAYYDQPLAIKGELEDLKSYGIFELDEEQAFGGQDLVVVQPQPRIKLSEEQTVIVYGVLRPLVTVELERDYDLGWDLSLQQQIEAEYFKKPVLVADKIIILESKKQF